MTPEQQRRVTRVVVAVAALSLTAIDHFHAHVAYLGCLNSGSSLLPVSRVAEPVPPALARRVVIVFIDGLGFDAAGGLPALEQLALRGTRRVLAIDFPSFTYPAVVALSTGLPPGLSGVSINRLVRWHNLPPTLLDEAARGGLQTRISDGGWPLFRELLDPSERSRAVALDDVLHGEDDRSLDFVYFADVDRAGHAHGGRSRAYQAAAHDADTLVARVVASLDLSRDALLILSDHGHLPRGGHGGAETEVRRGLFVAAGAGVRRGSGQPRPFVDLVPTVAALTGLPPPAASLGRPMLDVIDEQPAEAARRLAPAFAERLNLASGAIVDARPHPLLERLRTGDPTAIGPAELQLDAFGRARAARDEMAWRPAAKRRLWAALALCALLVLLIVKLSSWRAFSMRPRDALPALIYVTVFGALFFAAGYHISWSIPRGEPGFLVETALFGAAGSVAAFAVSRGRRFTRLAEETMAMMVLFGVPYVLCAAWAGIDHALQSGPMVSFSVPLLATLGFYAHGPFGVALLIREARSSTATPSSLG